MKQIKCNVCKKRYTRQQDWKTEEEKKVCFSCRVVRSIIKDTIIVIDKYAYEKGLKLHWEVFIGPISSIKELKSDKKLFTG